RRWEARDAFSLLRTSQSPSRTALLGYLGRCTRARACVSRPRRSRTAARSDAPCDLSRSRYTAAEQWRWSVAPGRARRLPRTCCFASGTLKEVALSSRATREL